MNSPKEIVIPDIQSSADNRQIAIDKVGIKSIRHPVSVEEVGGGIQKTVAIFNMYVGLPKDFKGTHMSRFVQILNQGNRVISVESFKNLLVEMVDVLEKHLPNILESLAAEIRLKADSKYKCELLKDTKIADKECI